jgi:hypothetical protein
VTAPDRPRRRTNLLLLALAVAPAPAAAAPPHAPAARPAPTGPAPFAAQRNIDVVGTLPGSIVSPEAWAALVAAAPALAAPDGGLDGIALRGPARPKAPKQVQVSLPSAGPATLLFGYSGDMARSEPIVRLTTRPAGGAPRTRDLLSGEDLFPLEAGGSGPGGVAVPAGGGRALSVVHVEAGDTITVEVRNPRVDVVLLGVASGSWLAGPAPISRPFAGFPYNVTLSTPGSAVPDGWRVPPDAAAQGPIRVKDGHLAFGDGRRARFWGVNLVNAACVPSHEMADRLAVHLAEHGINLARLHHCDSPKAGLLNPERTLATDPLFLDDGLDRFDYLVSRLQAAGVFVELEVATNRQFTAADGVTGPDNALTNKQLPMFEPTWRAAYFAWAKAWLDRKNPYTGRRYAEDPGVAMVELANENSLAMNWLTGAVERLPEAHRATLDAQWNQFLRTRYADDAALREAWTGSINPGLRRGETLGAITREPSAQGNFRYWPEARVADLYDFYAGLDSRFFSDLAAHVRAMGFTQPIVPGITWDTPMMARIFAPFDVVDAHIEWDAPNNRTLRNESLIANPRSQSLLDRFHVAQAGKPLIVSELNEGFPNDHMAEAPLLWATFASLQDWDALVWFDYINGPIVPDGGGVAGFADLRSSATKWVQMPLASGLFRSGALPMATGLVPQWRSDAAVKQETVGFDRPVWTGLRDVTVPLSARLREQYGGEPPLPIPGVVGPHVGWWPGAGRFVIVTDRVEAVLGDHALAARAGEGEGAGPTTAPHLDARLSDPAAVSLACTRGTLAECGEGLLTVAGRMENTGMARIGGGSVIVEQGDGPVLVERVRGSIRFAWPRRPAVHPVGVDGRLGAAVPVRADGAGWWSLAMDTAGDALIWRIDPPAGG